MKEENETIENKTAKKRISWLALISAIVLAIALLIGVYYFFTASETKPTSSNTPNQEVHSNVSMDTNESSGIDKYKSPSELNAEQNDQSQSDSALDYYNKGLKSFDLKNYQDAADNFAQAIKINPANEAYYNKKSQSEMNLGYKQKAIDTIKEGLKNIPESDLLKSRLDILQTDSLSNQVE